MIYLLWGLLNIGVMILFFAVCLKAVKLVKSHVGIGVAVFLVIGLCSFIGNSTSADDDYDKQSNQIKKWDFGFTDSLDQMGNGSVNIELEETLILSYYLSIEYLYEEASNNTIPLRAYSSTNGFISGTSWKPLSISMHPGKENNQYTYQVDGNVKWHILGVPVYYQKKSWRGDVLLK